MSLFFKMFPVCNTGCMLALATPTISCFKAWEMSQLPTRLHRQGHWIPKLRSNIGVQPLTIPINGKTPFLKFLRSLYLKQRAVEKQSAFSHFCGLIPDTNYKHFECFIMLGTHSLLCRGQMSYMWDRPLKVN